MAVEFHQYLQSCELSEFCVNLQSSLKNLIHNNEKTIVTVDSENQVAQAVLPDAPSKANRPISHPALEKESNAFTRFEPSRDICNGVADGFKSLQQQGQREILENSSSDLHDESVLYSDLRNKRCSLLAESLDYNNHQIRNLSTTENCFKVGHNSSDVSSTKICNQSNVIRPVDVECDDKSASPSLSFEILRETLTNETSSFCLEAFDDVTEHIDHQRSLDDADLKSRKFRQRQLSLPNGYSSIDAENSFQEGRARRRRHSVRFADEIGEILTTTITIPSNEEELIDAYSNSSVNIRDFSENYQQNHHNNNNSVNFSWGSSNLSAIGEVLEKRSSAAFFQSDEKKQSVSMFNLTFEQPSKNYDCFLRKLQVNGVCVESVQVHQNSGAVNNEPEPDELTTGPFYGEQFLCKVKVKNMDACKSIVARFTSNDWLTFTDVAAEYLPQEHQDVNEYDTFRFTITKPKLNKTDGNAHYNPINAVTLCSVEFAVRYQAGGLTFWDNNDGKNYKILWR